MMLFKFKITIVSRAFSLIFKDFDSIFDDIFKILKCLFTCVPAVNIAESKNENQL